MLPIPIREGELFLAEFIAAVGNKTFKSSIRF